MSSSPQKGSPQTTNKKNDKKWLVILLIFALIFLVLLGFVFLASRSKTNNKGFALNNVRQQ